MALTCVDMHISKKFQGLQVPFKTITSKYQSNIHSNDFCPNLYEFK